MQSIDLNAHVNDLEQQYEHQVMVFCYSLASISECVRRGLRAVNTDCMHRDTIIGRALAEKLPRIVPYRDRPRHLGPHRSCIRLDVRCD